MPVSSHRTGIFYTSNNENELFGDAIAIISPQYQLTRSPHWLYQT